VTAAFAVAVEDELAAVAVTALAFHLDLCQQLLAVVASTAVVVQNDLAMAAVKDGVRDGGATAKATDGGETARPRQY